MKLLDFNGIGEILSDVRFPKGALRTVTQHEKESGSIAPNMVWITKHQDKYIICENKKDLEQTANDLKIPVKNLKLSSLSRRNLYHTELRRYEPEFRDKHSLTSRYHYNQPRNIDQMFSWQKFGDANQNSWPHGNALVGAVSLFATSLMLAPISYLLTGAGLCLTLSMFGYQYYLNAQLKFTFTEEEHKQFSQPEAQAKAKPQAKAAKSRSYTPLAKHQKQKSRRQTGRRASQPGLFTPGLFKKPALRK